MLGATQAGASGTGRTQTSPTLTTTTLAGATGVTVTTAGSGTTATTAATAPAVAKTTSRVADENRKIWVVVGALVAVAAGLLALTIVYLSLIHI